MKRGIAGFARIHAITVDFGAAFGPERYTRERQARIQFGIARTAACFDGNYARA